MKRILILLILLGFIGALVWAFLNRDELFSQEATVAATALAPSPELLAITPQALVQEYHNETHNFSLKLPEHFLATEVEADDFGAETVVLQNERGEGIQIVITPFDEDLQVLSEERIRADVPDMMMSAVQPVEIGASHIGLAFKSDNEAFEGASREVWFVFRGHLYQISTYERFDRLLQTMFSTWKFL